MKSKGFTLIELLVVIALIGVLAGVILVVIDPLEQFERGRDAARKSAVRQIVGAVQAYYVSHNALYPDLVNSDPTNTWIQQLVDSGELKTVPPVVGSVASGCTPRSHNGYCYDAGRIATERFIFVELLSKSEKTKCAANADGEATNDVDVFFLWSSGQARAGIVCNSNADGNPWVSGGTNDSGVNFTFVGN